MRSHACAGLSVAHGIDAYQRARALGASVAILALVTVLLGATVPIERSVQTSVLAIVHPMQPIGNIDCCH